MHNKINSVRCQFQRENNAKDEVLTANLGHNSPCKTPAFPAFCEGVTSSSLHGLSAGKAHIGAIVAAKNNTKIPPKVRVAGYTPTDNVETVALDSGACEAVLAPHAFKNTDKLNTKSNGTKYLACGGEKVTNTGEKRVVATDSEGNVLRLNFQCTDKITRNLAAASKICETGKGIWLGPGPKFEAFIAHKPETVNFGRGPKTPVGLRNGVYEFNLRELITNRKPNLHDKSEENSHHFAGYQPYRRELCAGEVAPKAIEMARNDPYEHAGGSTSQSIDTDEENKDYQTKPKFLHRSAPGGNAPEGGKHGPVKEFPDGFEMCSPCEQAPVQVIRDPCKPSQKEIDEHYACGHAPFRDWCDICIRGRAVDDPHAPSKGGTDIPIYEMDFCFPSSKEDPENNLTVFVMKQRQRKVLAATVVPCKGTGREVNFAATCLTDFISELGHSNTDIIIKSDNEPVLNTIREQVAAARKAATREEHSPVGSSQSNGSIENAVKKIEGQIRSIKLSVESRYNCKLPINHFMTYWIANHAAFCINRFEIGSDGKTPYQHVRGKPFSGKMCELGEHVHA